MGTRAHRRRTARARRAARLPREWLQTGDKGIRLRDVADGTTAMADFVAQFSDEELCTIVRGEG